MSEQEIPKADATLVQLLESLSPKSKTALQPESNPKEQVPDVEDVEDEDVEDVVDEDVVDEDVEDVPAPVTPVPPVPPPAPLVPVEEPVFTQPSDEPIVPSELLVPTPEKDDELGVKDLLQKFRTHANKIIGDHDADRQQIQEAIRMLQPYVEQSVAGSKPKITSIIVESWAKLLQTKAEITSNGVSVLDSISRLISAAKNNQIVLNQQNVQAGSVDLKDILSQPPEEDEDGSK